MRRSDREVTEIDLIEEIIKKADVCRVAFANDNIPYMVTLNFGYINDKERMLFFHCANTGRKLEMIKNNDYVCFEMDIDHKLFKGDKSCDWGMSFRSVVGYGRINVVTGNEERIKGLNSIMTHYGGECKYSYNEKVFEKTTILCLKIIEMTGKKK